MVAVWVLHMLHFVLFYQDEENVVSPKTMQKLLLLVLPTQGTWKWKENISPRMALYTVRNNDY